MDENMERKDQGGFFDRLGWTFYAPSRLFEDIERGAVSWWQPCIWLALIIMLTTLISLPIQRLIMEINEPGLPDETLQKILDFWPLVAAFEVISSPIAVILVALVTGLIGYLLIKVIATNPTFKKFFTLYLYASIVGSAGGLLSILVVRFMKGLQSIQSSEDAVFSIGLSFLAPPENKFLEAIFMNIDLFAIWALVIIAMGLTHIFKMPRNLTILCVIPFWLFGVVMFLLKGIFHTG
jgi:hypothetical protein